MNPVFLAQILVKVFAIYVMQQGIGGLARFLVSFFESAMYVSLRGWLILFGALVPLALGVCLWRFSARVSGVIVGQPFKLEVGETHFPHHFLRAAVVVSGLLIVVTNLPTFLYSLVNYIIEYEEFEANAYTVKLLVSGAKATFGLILLMGIGYLVKCFSDFRTFGLEEQNLPSTPKGKN